MCNNVPCSPVKLQCIDGLAPLLLSLLMGATCQSCSHWWLLQVRRVLLDEARKRFSRVQRVPVAQYGPKSLQLEYVDIWELQL